MWGYNDVAFYLLLWVIHGEGAHLQAIFKNTSTVCSNKTYVFGWRERLASTLECFNTPLVPSINNFRY